MREFLDGLSVVLGIVSAIALVLNFAVAIYSMWFPVEWFTSDSNLFFKIFATAGFVFICAYILHIAVE